MAKNIGFIKSTKERSKSKKWRDSTIAKAKKASVDQFPSRKSQIDIRYFYKNEVGKCG